MRVMKVEKLSPQRGSGDRQGGVFFHMLARTGNLSNAARRQFPGPRWLLLTFAPLPPTPHTTAPGLLRAAPAPLAPTSRSAGPHMAQLFLVHPTHPQQR